MDFKENCFHIKVIFIGRFQDDDDDVGFNRGLRVNVVDSGDVSIEFCRSRKRKRKQMLCKLYLELPPPVKDPEVS